MVGSGGCDDAGLASCGVGLFVVSAEVESGTDNEESSLSVKAGLSLSIVTCCYSFAVCKRNVSAERCNTSKGPSYTGCNGFRVASCRIKTWVEVASSG